MPLRRAERADDRHESSKDDGDAAVLLVERVSSIEMLLVNSRESSRLNSRGPVAAPMAYPTVLPTIDATVKKSPSQ